MKLTIRIDDGYITPYSEADRNAILELKNGVYQVDAKNMDYRTIKQNAALHKYFSWLKTALNDAGLTITKVLKVDVQWTDESVKYELWRPIMKAVTGKSSTTKLTKQEVSDTYDALNLYLGERHGVSVPFPHKEME